jgi:hypothetical protein
VKKSHVVGPRPLRTWCGRRVADVLVKSGSFHWEDPSICGSCYARAEEAQIRDARRAQREAEQKEKAPSPKREG